jgi:hypothetical protein
VLKVVGILQKIRGPQQRAVIHTMNPIPKSACASIIVFNDLPRDHVLQAIALVVSGDFRIRSEPGLQ